MLGLPAGRSREGVKDWESATLFHLPLRWWPSFLGLSCTRVRNVMPELRNNTLPCAGDGKLTFRANELVQDGE